MESRFSLGVIFRCLAPRAFALGEDVGLGRDAFKRSRHHLLGMAQTINRRGVDPVEAGFEPGADCGNRLAVVLRSPGESPASAAHGPGANTHGSDHQIAVTQLAFFHESLLRTVLAESRGRSECYTRTESAFFGLEWRNWQTHGTQNPAAFTVMRVRPPPPAPPSFPRPIRAWRQPKTKKHFSFLARKPLIPWVNVHKNEKLFFVLMLLRRSTSPLQQQQLRAERRSHGSQHAPRARRGPAIQHDLFEHAEHGRRRQVAHALQASPRGIQRAIR